MPNIQIKNLLGQSVKISLKKPGEKKAVEVTLQPHETLPNQRRPNDIVEDEVTPYTKGLVTRKFVRVRPVRAA